VDKNQTAVDEGAEECVPADARLVLGHRVLAAQTDLRAIRFFRDREQVMRAREVDDLAVVLGRCFGHGPPLA